MMPMSEHSTRHTPWRRWEMTCFDAPALQTRVQSDASARMRIEAELEHRQRQAQESGHAQGYAQGHAEGLTHGTRAGHAEGLRQGHEEGLQAGFQAGLQQGLQEGQETARQHVQQLQHLAQTCAHALNTLEHEVGHALVSLATSIAERVLHSTLAVHPEKILDIVRDIVQMHGDSDAVLTLRVHPHDHDLVQHYLDQDSALKRWRLLADDTLQAGGCQAETALGAVDATLQTRWRKVLGSLGIDAMTHASAHTPSHALAHTTP